MTCWSSYLACKMFGNDEDDYADGLLTLLFELEMRPVVPAPLRFLLVGDMRMETTKPMPFLLHFCPVRTGKSRRR